MPLRRAECGVFPRHLPAVFAAAAFYPLLASFKNASVFASARACRATATATATACHSSVLATNVTPRPPSTQTTSASARTSTEISLTIYTALVHRCPLLGDGSAACSTSSSWHVLVEPALLHITRHKIACRRFDALTCFVQAASCTTSSSSSAWTGGRSRRLAHRVNTRIRLTVYLRRIVLTQRRAAGT